MVPAALPAPTSSFFSFGSALHFPSYATTVPSLEPIAASTTAVTTARPSHRIARILSTRGRTALSGSKRSTPSLSRDAAPLESTSSQALDEPPSCSNGDSSVPEAPDVCPASDNTSAQERNGLAAASTREATQATQAEAPCTISTTISRRCLAKIE